MYEKIKYLPSGDKAVVMEFGDEISKEINYNIRNVIRLISRAKIKGIIEVLPTYRSIMIMYDPLETGYLELIGKLDTLASRTAECDEEKIRIVEIPTLYGGEFGSDIDFVARHNNITVDEVIRIHTGTDYLVYMLGFIPGFAYLGGMSEKLATPRLPSPRAKIPAGSVGIAGKQTGMYPSEAPGGWQLIGKTPLQLYNPKKEPPVLLNAGDYVRYVSITKQEYFDIQKLMQEDNYKVNAIYVDGGELCE